MKQVILIIVLSLMINTVTAQNFKGQAIYQSKRDVKVKVSTSMSKQKAKELEAMFRKYNNKKYVLTFNQFESIYMEEDKLATPGNSGITVMGFGGNIYYKNLKDKRYVNQKESYSKEFLIKDTLPELKWEMAKDSKQIGNYLCFKATAKKQVRDYKKEREEREKTNDKDKDDENSKKYYKDIDIIAWYTPEIPVNNGPREFGGLPGLILELHNNKTIYLCEKITMNPKEAKAIKEPKKGKEVTQKEYDAIMDKKSKEMMEMYKSKKGRKGKESGMTITIG